MRLSIEVTQEQHQLLKAVAALRGQSIKDYVLERVLPPLPDINVAVEGQALRQLEAFLPPKLKEEEQYPNSKKPVGQVFNETHQKQPAQ